MAAGFQAINDWGTYQVDETFHTLAYRQAFGVYFSSNGYLSTTTFSITAETPVICWNSPFGCGIALSSQSGSTWTYTMHGSAAGWVTIYVFDRPGFVGGNVGVEVFNGNGVKTFSSNARYMKLVAAPSPPSGDIQTWTWNGLGPGTYAVALSNRPNSIQWVPSPGEGQDIMVYTPLAQQTTYGAQVSYINSDYIEMGIGAAGQTFLAPSQVWIIDVAGY